MNNFFLVNKRFSIFLTKALQSIHMFNISTMKDHI